MKLSIILALLLASPAQAFILVFKNYRLSKPEETKIKISSEGCGSNVSDAELKDAIESAAEMWSSVPEALLRMEYGGKSGTSVNSATVPKGEVIVGCAPLTGAAGATSHDIANGSARVRLNSNQFRPGQYSHGQLAGVLIHEIGHAVGLHHSKDPSSVMTYESNGWEPMPSYLSQDDVDGVTYLYPNEKELGGLLGSCDSYASSGAGGGGTGNFLGQLFTAFFISLAIFGLRARRK